MFKARVKLPKNRPGNWWSLTVNLPCRPPLFIYRNAYCIKSEDEKIRRTSYSLTQNKKTGKKSAIRFEAIFNSKCNFTAKDVKIEWDESFPAQKFPQVSSLPVLDNQSLKTILQSKRKPQINQRSGPLGQNGSRGLLNDLGLSLSLSEIVKFRNNIIVITLIYDFG